MNWLNPEDAPKGHYEEFVQDTKKGSRTFAKFCPDRIIAASSSGFVCETYWIPPRERGPRYKEGRWHKLAENDNIVGWMPMPEWKE